LLLCLPAGCGPAPRHEVKLYAAASTREAVERLAAEFRSRTGTRVELNFGPSSGLARQIEEGGGADLFLSADEGWADYLERAGLVAARRDLLGNRLVVIAPATGEVKLKRLKELGTMKYKLALAAPAVPAGKYARHALVRAGVWDQVKEHVVSGKDVRATLTFVEQGEVEMGIVYATDAMATGRVRTILEVPAELHEHIRYPLALIGRESVGSEARELFEFLASDRAEETFKAAGFTWLAR
jgi:molybdate transport system substrate-binding protein